MSAIALPKHWVRFGWLRRTIPLLVWLPILLGAQSATAATPTITSFTPTSGAVGTSVTINGTNFSSTPASNTVKFNGIAATTPSSATTTKLVVLVPTGATTGTISVTVGTSTGTSSSPFTVAPTITSFTPTSGPIGTSVTINGTNFSSTIASNTVKFNGTAVTTISSATTTKLVVLVPSGATTGAITVTVGTLTGTSGTNFTVSPPTITSFTPASGPVGTSVTINGTNFSTTAANNIVKFNGVTAATPTSATAIKLVVAVPIGATSGTISVTVGALTGTSGSTFAVSPPTVTNFTPTSGPVGTSVTITGTNFSTTAANNAVKFNGIAAAAPTSATATQLVVAVPIGATTGTISVTVGALTGTSSGTFTVSPPTITSFTPASGPVGTTVTITGTNFSTTKSNNTVKFNGTTAATPTTATTTQLVVTVPSGATTGTITVTVGALTGTSSSTFTVASPPSISGFTPTSGPVSTTVTISGANFSTTPSANTVKFNGTTAATPTSATAAQLVVVVPSGATTGTITVTVGTLTGTSGTSFTVTTPPIITSFTPTSGAVGATVTINGSNFSSTKSANTVKFNGTPAAVPTSASATQLVVAVPSGATTGTITVTVGTLTGTSATNFTVAAPAPTITGFAPSSGPVGTAVTITGTNFSTVLTDNAVTFNGTAAIVSTATATQLVAAVPAGATTGKIKVTIGTQSATSGANFTVTVSIFGFSPSTGSVGTTVNIQGQGFSTTKTANAVKFNGTAATVTAATTSQLTVSVPNGASTGPITVTTASNTATSGSNFVIAPTIYSINPTAGPVGSTVAIEGLSFDAITSNNTVTFNGVSANVTSATTNELIVTVPGGATSGGITVTVAGASATSTSFTVMPAIAGFSPTSGAAGTPVTVTGTSFNPVAGQTVVLLNATPITPTVLTDTQIVFNVPANTSTGKIQITTPAGQVTSANNFSISPPGIGPIASSVAIAPDGPSQTLNIAAANTNAALVFDAQADHWLTLAVNTLGTTPSGGSVTYAFVGPNNQVLSQGSISSSDVTVQVPPILTAGTYQIVFSSGSNSAVSINAALTSDRVIALVKQDGAFDTSAQTNVVGQSIRFTFAGNAGDTLGLGITDLALSVVDGTPTDRRILVFAPNSTAPLASGSCYPDAHVGAPGYENCDLNLPTLIVDGTYSVVVDLGVVDTGIYYISDLQITSNVNASIPTGSAFSWGFASGQNALLSFQANAGETVNLVFSNRVNSNNYFPSGIVRAPGGDQIASFGGQATLVTTTRIIPLSSLPATGTYTIFLDPLEYGSAEDVSVDSSSANTTVLVVDGRSNIGSTSVAGQSLSYTFTGSAGQDLSLGISTLTLSPSGSSATVVVTQPNGSQIASTAACQLGCILDLGSLPANGNYTVTITPNASATMSLFATLSTSVSGTITTLAPFNAALTRYGQLEKIKFTASAGQSYGLYVPPYQNNGGWQFKILRPNGATLSTPLQLNLGNRMVPLINLPDTGDYTIELGTMPANTDLPPNLAMTFMIYASTSLVTDGPILSWDIATAGQMGLYTFSATAGQSLGLGLTLPISGGGGFRDGATIYVLKPDGTLLTNPWTCLSGTLYFYGSTLAGCNIDMSRLGQTVDHSIPVSGNYTVIVTTDPLLGNPSFNIALSSWSTGQLTVGGPTLNSAIQRPGQAAAITFDGVAGQVLQLKWLPVGYVGFVGQFGYYLEIYDPAGNKVSEASFLGAYQTSSSVDIPTLKTSGTYTIYYVNAYGNTGTLQLTLPTLTACENRSGPIATTVSSVTAQPNPPTVGQPFTVSAAVSPSVPVCGQPQGTVTIQGSYQCSYDTAVASGCTVTSPYAGTLQFVANFAPADTTTFQAGLSDFYAYIAVQGEPVNVAITSSTPEPSALGEPYSVEVNVAPVPPSSAPPTGYVTVSDGAQTCSIYLPSTSCTLYGSVSGTVSLTAAYGGDATYAQTTSSPHSHSVGAPATVNVAIMSVAPEPSFVSQPYTVIAAVTPISSGTAPPTGSVTISNGSSSCSYILPANSCSLPSTALGTVSLTATYGGDTNNPSAVSAAVSHTIASGGASQICGFDPSIVPNDPPGFVPITQLSGSAQSPGLVRSITGTGALSITIMSPGPGATTSESNVDVVGTFSGPSNTGITVNGVIGSSVNGQFLVHGVPLNAGMNTLNVTATTMTGATATNTAAINQGASAPPISIAVGSHTTAAGLAPHTITFDYTIRTLLNNAGVQSVAIDLNGDGTYDYTATTLASLPTTFVFSQPGMFAVTFRVIDTQGNTYLAKRTVLIQDLEQQRGILCDVYGYLKDRLSAQDATGASNAYQPLARSQYQAQFAAFGSNMPNVVPMLGVISAGLLGAGYAEMTLIRDNADQSRSGFPLRMTLGADGVWRISEM